MKLFIQKKINREAVVAGVFFLLYLILGLSIYRGYGVYWDEISQRTVGYHSLRYILYSDPGLLTYSFPYNGPVFEMFLYGMERLLKVSQSSEMIYLRHLLTFLTFFAGVFFFYLLNKKIFKNWVIALTGSAILVLSPRIFENSFYNSKDIPLLVFFIIGAYTLLVYLEKRSLKSLVVHALACALANDVRVIGGLLVGITVLFMCWNFVEAGRFSRKYFGALFGHLALYASAWYLFVFLFWPILWTGPIQNFINALVVMSRFQFYKSGTVFFLGERIQGGSLPWYYVPVWIFVSTPFVYLAGFFVGLVGIVKELVLGWQQIGLFDRQSRVLALAWFFIPLGLLIGLHSIIYDTWRHMFFIYPALVIICLFGLEYIFRLIRRQAGLNRATRAGLVSLLPLSLLAIGVIMIHLHPYEQLYFNVLPGQNLGQMQALFDMDFWGLSYRPGLEYILKTDHSRHIKLAMETAPVRFNLLLLPESEQARIEFVKNTEEADYYLTNYRYHTAADYRYPNEVFSVVVDGAKIDSVFKLK